MRRFRTKTIIFICLAIFSLATVGCARAREPIPAAEVDAGAALPEGPEGATPTALTIATATPAPDSQENINIAPTATATEAAAPAENAEVSSDGITNEAEQQEDGTSVAPSETNETAEEVAVHVVRPGENLFRISQRYGVTLEELGEFNGITNTNLVYVGQSIRIPGTVTVSSGGNYTVRPGDTLASIAFAHDTTIEALVAANNLSNANFIYVGQELTIP